MDTGPSNAADLRFERGGLARRLMQLAGFMKGDGPSVWRRSISLVLITWVPLLILSIIDGRAIGPTPRESFLYDFGTYARFLVTLPLFFAAEGVVGARLREAGLHFVTAGLVRDRDMAAVEAAIERSRRLREALLPEVLMLATTVFATSYHALGAWQVSTAPIWNTTTMHGGAQLSLAGTWYHFVSLPVFQFFLLWWFWRLAIWTLYLYTLSRLKLRLPAAHSDRMAGLSFLADAHGALALFVFAVGWVVSGNVAFRIYFGGAQIQGFQTLLTAYLVAGALVCFGPLLLFVPLLTRTRWEGLERYNVLVGTYDRLFEDKWMKDVPPDEPLLGSADIQSLADIGNSWKPVEEMKMLPFGLRHIARFLIIASLPCIPLLLLAVPVRDVLEVITRALLF